MGSPRTPASTRVISNTRSPFKGGSPVKLAIDAKVLLLSFIWGPRHLCELDCLPKADRQAVQIIHFPLDAMFPKEQLSSRNQNTQKTREVLASLRILTSIYYVSICGEDSVWDPIPRYSQGTAVVVPDDGLPTEIRGDGRSFGSCCDTASWESRKFYRSSA